MPSRARVNATSDTQQLAEDIRRASSQVPSVSVTSGRFTAQIGQAVRVRPGAAGVELNLPPADAASAGGGVTLFVEPAGGVCTVRCANGTVNAQVSVTHSAAGLVLYESNGKGGWFSPTLANSQVTTNMLANNAVTDAKLRNSAAYSVIGRAAGTTGNPADISLAGRMSTLLGRVLGGNVDALSRLELAQVMLPRVRSASLRDLFVGGGTTDGNIGELGWRLWGGTYSRANNSTVGGSSRSLLTSPTAAIGSIGLGTTGGANGGWSAANQIFFTQWRVNTQVAAAPANFQAFIGWTDTPLLNQGAVDDCFGLITTNSAANWRMFARLGAATVVDTATTLAYAADQQFTFTIIQAAVGVFDLYIDNTLAGTITQTFPGSFSPVFNALTTTAASTFAISPLGWGFAPRTNIFTSETFLDTLV